MSFLFMLFWIRVLDYLRELLCITTGWAKLKLSEANAVSFVPVKHALENFDNFLGW